MVDFKTEVKRINGYLKEVTTFLDSSGKPITHVMNPVMTELKPRDCFQIFIGAIIFGAPLCYTEEIWNLSVSIPELKVHALNIFGFVSIGFFVYFNFYRHKIAGNIINYVKRCIGIFVITFSTITFFMFLIGKLPHEAGQMLLAYKRVSLISFPALFSASISDMLK
ncbi:MAG: DUF2391 family protein [Halobacteriovoraceae bacterium]|nr:DUF2391 family protein [Halobacteriovoraceae bacterium]